MTSEVLACPLCHEAKAVESFHRDIQREYVRCQQCGLVFVPPEYFLSLEAEKKYYDLHNNNPGDSNYRKFLGRLAQPLLEQLPPGSRGLDFGSGPGPTLSKMLARAGLPTAIYDPFYCDDSLVWNQNYDFITASEVVEHLRRPHFELSRLWSLLRPGGILGVMTKRVIDRQRFSTWHYKNDPTHIAYFSETTFRWLADSWNADLQILEPDVVLLRK